MAARLDLTLVNGTLQFGIAGQKVKSDSGKLQARDAADSVFVNMQGLDAVADEDFVTLSQLNSAILGLFWHEPVDVATTVAGTLATDFENGDTVDGVVLVTGMRILIKDQASGIENGIYIVEAAGAPTRATDMATGSNAASAAMFVEQGTSNADIAFVCTNDTGSAVVGTDALVFVAFTSALTGISTIALAGGATGVSIIDSGTGPTATLRGILGESGVLTAAIVSDDVVISVDALGIDTAKIANDAITEAKIANSSGVLIARRLVFTFSDAPSVSMGADVPSGSTVMGAYISVTTGWSAGTTLQLGTSGTPGLLVDTAENDPSTTDIYSTDNDEFLGADTPFIVTIGGAPGVGAAVASLTFTI